MVPWYQTVGIVIAAVVAVVGVPKLLRETLGPYRLGAKVLRASEVAEKVKSEGAKRELTAYAETLANRLAAIHTTKFSRRDKIVIAGGASVSVTLWLLFLVGWPVSVPEKISNRALELVAVALAVLIAQWGLLLWLPRLQTIQYRRVLYAELGAPAGLRDLSIPSLRDYFLNATLTPKFILTVARQAASKAASNGSGDEVEGDRAAIAPAVVSPTLTVAIVNAAIEECEGIYRHTPARR